MDDIQICREHVRERGIPDRVAEWWLRLARPRVVLDRIDDDAGEVPVAGYYGGSPFLPEGVGWSGRPHFVASVDCAALPKLPDLPLPEDGQLLFFGNKGEIDFSARASRGQVLYVPAGTATSESVVSASELEEFEREPFPIPQRFPLRQSFHWSLPSLSDNSLDGIEDVYDIYEQFDLDDLSWDFCETGTFALGGYGTVVHTDPCEAESGDGDWCLLAETKNNFSDLFAGYVYWVIRRQDLIERRFDRVKTVMQAVA